MRARAPTGEGSPRAPAATQRARRRAAAVALALATLLPATGAGAQGAGDATLSRALDLEAAGRFREAVPLFRQALRSDLTGALLGLERAYASLGQTDSLLTTLDSLVAARPREALVRSVQLRALQMAGADARAQSAFARWVQAAPRDPQPYRDYARLLLETGRTTAADTVLQQAQRALGSGRDVAFELAQLRAQLGLWELSAQSWREALATADYLHQAAVYALQPTPVGERSAVRAVLAARPTDAGARRVLAWLELGWGSPAQGWEAIATLAPTDSVVETWIEFAGEAEARAAWATAAQALIAAQRARPSPALTARAADAALAAGQAEQALALVTAALRARGLPDSAAQALLPLQVRALSRLGRAGDADRVVREASARDGSAALPLQRELAWAWVRAGDLDRARTALMQGGVDPDDEIHGWLALYAGDLRQAREQLRGTSEARGPDEIAALALLVRTAADSAPAAGAAFLALARGDSARAAALFEEAAAQHGDAAPLLLGAAARLHASRGDAARAIALWERLTARHAASPEAAEAELAWARLLRRRGDQAGAIARLEHLILTYPRSALVPQARRELDAARGAIPSGTPSPGPPHP